MAHPATAELVRASPAKRRKATQRERLLAGMVTAANRDGYAGANVSAVIREAGVSRPTFYDYFEDRDDCFVATVVDVHDRLMRDMRDALDTAPPERALAAAVEATLAFASSRTADARFFMKEALAGGPNALDARDRGIAQAAKMIEDALARAHVSALTPDVPVAAVLGGVHRLLASRLRRGERAIAELREDLLQWLDSYARPVGERRWHTLTPLAALERPAHLPPLALRAPPPLGPGRPRLSEEEVAENHRQRIMFATSQIVFERGFAAATVADITRLAGVDGRVFYRLFADKHEAFNAIHELGFHHLMAAAAGAFFAGTSWPDRIWEAFRAVAHSIDENPTVAHVAFVEAYAVGPRGIQRVEDSRIAFAIFLQEGYQQQGASKAPSPAALETIITTIFEIVYIQARADSQATTSTLVAHFAHLCLTPFVGAAAGNRFIDRRLAETPRTTRSNQRGRRSKQRAVALVGDDA